MLHRRLPAGGHRGPPRQVRAREPPADGGELSTHRRRPERPERIRVGAVAWDDADGAALRARQQDELRARYAGESEPGTAPSGADVALFLVARDAAGTAVGCGGLRPLEEGVAEIKRMYVDPLAREIPPFGPYVGAPFARCFERRLA